jgi:hypothetical protein
MTLLRNVVFKIYKTASTKKVTVQLFYENLTQEIASSTLKSQSERKNDYKTNIDK